MDLEHERRLTQAYDLAKSNADRIDTIEKRQDDLDELVSTVKVLAVREEAVENDVKEIKSDVKVLTNKPAQRWDSIVDKTVWAVLAAMIAYMLGQMGL